MNTIENNKLIADFLGYKFTGNNDRLYTIPEHLELQAIPYSHDVENVDYFTPKKMKYHSDWNWLMPVVEKIEVVYSFSTNIRRRMDMVQVCTFSNHEKEIIGMSHNKLEATYKAVIKFIKWHNNNHIIN